MGIHIISGEYNGRPAAWLIDGVTEWAFGPRFTDEEEADEFIAYCDKIEEVRDLRALNDRMLRHLHSKWLAWRDLASKYMDDPETLEEIRDELEKSVLVERLQQTIDVVEGRRAANANAPVGGL